MSSAQPTPAEAMIALLRAVQTLRTYPADNEMSIKALADAETPVVGALPIDLGLTQSGVLAEGAAVEGLTEERLRILTPLFRDGIREIRLRPGLAGAELKRFVLALAEVIDPDDLSQDYVTRLWEADLPHVDVMALDPYLACEDGEDVLEGKDEPEARADEPLRPDWADLPPPPEEAFRVSEEDLLRVAQEVEHADRFPSWGPFIGALFATLSSPIGASRTDELVQMIEATFQRCVKARLWTLAQLVVERLRGDYAAPVKAQLEGARERMLQPERLEPLHQALSDAGAKPEKLRALWAALGPDGIAPMLRFLAEGDSEAAARTYVEVLSGLGSDALQPVTEAFRVGEDGLRAQLAKVLAAIPGAEAAEVLVEALERQDDPIRPELVRALGAQGDREAAERLIKIALDDADRKCRIIALRSLGGASGRLGQGRLLERIRSGAGSSLDDEELDLLFQAIGRVGDNECIPLLAGLLKPGLFGLRNRPVEWRRAAGALARLGTQEALAVLEPLTGHRNADLSHICAEALREAPKKRA